MFLSVGKKTYIWSISMCIFCRIVFYHTTWWPRKILNTTKLAHGCRCTHTCNCAWPTYNVRDHLERQCTWSRTKIWDISFNCQLFKSIGQISIRSASILSASFVCLYCSYRLYLDCTNDGTRRGINLWTSELENRGIFHYRTYHILS